jgi:IS30 family transposase
MGCYRRMTQEARVRIKDGLDAGLTKSAIADKLGFNKSTISRECRRNCGKRGYRPKQAETKAQSRLRHRSWLRKWDGHLANKVRRLLKKKWSPEQISRRMELENEATVSHERIYQFIEQDKLSGGSLWKNLRYSHRSRRRRFASRERRGKIQNATCIEKRKEAGANNRSRVGHWERDTMVGGERKTGVLVCVDRKSRFLKLRKLKRKTAARTAQATVSLLKTLPCRTITNDRGQEFQAHEQVADKLKVKVYFCHPYTSSERGTNENRIGIVRQYLPKKMNLADVTDHEIQRIETEINNRPMKCLDWRTPLEILSGQNVALTN